MDASKAVIVGLSAAPTDFCTSWLLRSTVGTREGVPVEAINPCNDESHPGHKEFKGRMDSIFLKGYLSNLHEFSQIESSFNESIGR
jgi:hypothetical protein